MDGFQENDQILVVAATNLLCNIDEALQRPGRFDRKIEIELPDLQARIQILNIHLRSRSHSINPLTIETAAKSLEGYSGADIENLVNLMALQNVRQSRMKHQTPLIKDEDLVRAVSEMIPERNKSKEKKRDE
jgi:cell division protease FtsH